MKLASIYVFDQCSHVSAMLRNRLQCNDGASRENCIHPGRICKISVYNAMPLFETYINNINTINTNYIFKNYVCKEKTSQSS